MSFKIIALMIINSNVILSNDNLTFIIIFIQHIFHCLGKSLFFHVKLICE